MNIATCTTREPPVFFFCCFVSFLLQERRVFVLNKKEERVKRWPCDSGAVTLVSDITIFKFSLLSLFGSPV